MDAVRLIRECQGALTASQEVPGIMREVWQAQALAQAVGGRLAVTGPPELRGDALGLSEASGRGCGTLDARPPGGGEIRAARLSRIADIRETLTGLGSLLGEVGITLVGVACSADADRYYWQCIESIDAADESRDRVLEMLRRLTTREQGLVAPDPLAGPP